MKTDSQRVASRPTCFSECSAIIMCQGRKANNQLADALIGKVKTVHVVGDARSPRSYGNALHEAAYLARQI